jgi:hypothetical protein
MWIPPPPRRVIVDAASFAGESQPPESIQKQLITLQKQRVFDADSDWIGQFPESAVDALQQQGYFRATVSAEAQVIGGDSRREHVMGACEGNQIESAR